MQSTEHTKQTKSKERVRAHGEVFTAEREVNAMLDLVKNECERIESRFLEPACGTGNFLIKILERKLNVVDAVYRRVQYEWETRAFLAVSSIYGVELLPDNAAECRARLFDYFLSRYRAQFKKTSERYLKSIRYLLEKNIICGDALTLLTSAGEPIVFSEWSFVSGSKVQRRDFTMNSLLSCHPEQSRGGGKQNTLFDLSPEEKLPKEVGRFPAVHYLEIATYESHP